MDRQQAGSYGCQLIGLSQTGQSEAVLEISAVPSGWHPLSIERRLYRFIIFLENLPDVATKENKHAAHGYGAQQLPSVHLRYPGGTPAWAIQ